MKISDHPIIFYRVNRKILNSSWISHSPFAFFLISILKPRTFVELGVYVGQSYHSFCQAVKALRLDTQCYGIDTWRGDEHVNFYKDDIFNEINNYNEKEYSSFSHLIRKTFEEGLSNFKDGSIDLLHIDGFHSYEAVKKDFETWLPKLSDRGVVVLHDTFIKDSDFGVWKFWEEISGRYPSFEFYHGCGLGVVAVGKNVNPEFLEFISEANSDTIHRKLFYILGMRVIDKEVIDNDYQTINQLKNDIVNLQNKLNALDYRLAHSIHMNVDKIIPHGSFRRSVLVSPLKISLQTVKKITNIFSKGKINTGSTEHEPDDEYRDVQFHPDIFFHPYYKESLNSINSMPVPEITDRKRKCAIFVMVKDEKIFLPIWLKYYSKSFSGEDIYVFDHRTSDNSITECKKKFSFNVIRLDYPFSFDHEWFKFVANNTQKKLLKTYEYVIFTDVDEILFPVKDKYRDLRDYIDQLKNESVQAKGYELICVENKDQDYDPEKSVLSQRKYWYEIDWYDKTLISQHPLDWNIGFHTVRGRVSNIDTNLLLIHLHKLDFKICWKNTFERARLWWLQSEVTQYRGWQNRITDIDDFREYYYSWPEDLSITEIPESIIKTDDF